MKMDCGVYYNELGFTVGRKWLCITEAGTRKIIGKYEVTEELKKELEKIKDETVSRDAARTQRVLALVRDVPNLLEKFES